MTRRALILVAALGGALHAQGPATVGRGCTTAYFIDADCDGYGVGKKSSGSYPLGLTGTQGQPWDGDRTGDMPDADDEDPAVHTTAEWQAKWGSGNAAIVNFLRTRKGFNNAGRVWYLSQSGNDATAAVNDPSRPYATLDAIFPHLSDWKGGVIVIRGGVWTTLDWGGPGATHNFSGSDGHGLYIMAYPGELVVDQIYASNSWFALATAYAPGKAAGYVTLDGIVFRASRWYIGNLLTSTDSSHLTLINCEVAGGTQTLWGNHTEDALIKWSVFHDMQEHAVYFNSYQVPRPPPGDFDFAADEAAYQVGKSPGASYRGQIVQNVMYNCGLSGYGTIHINTYTRDVVVDGNVVSYSGGNALDLSTGVYYSTIRNNVFFDNGRCAITLFTPIAAQAPNQIRYITIENNTIWVGNRTDVIRDTEPDCGIYALSTSTADYPVQDVTVRNNIFVTNNIDPTRGRWAGGSVPLAFALASHPETWTIQNNLFWSNGPSPAAATDAVLVIAPTAGSSYSGKLTLVQMHAADPKYSGNIYADPKFGAASNGYTLTPERFNLEPAADSAAVDAGISSGAATDVKARVRMGRPDIGAYEHGARAVKDDPHHGVVK